MSNLASYVLVTDAENVIVFHDISLISIRMWFRWKAKCNISDDVETADFERI